MFFGGHGVFAVDHRHFTQKFPGGPHKFEISRSCRHPVNAVCERVLYIVNLHKRIIAKCKSAGANVLANKMLLL